MRKHIHKHTAFTLIELLVVIVIIGILATIGVSTFSGYFEKAKRANAQYEMNQIIKAIRIMEIDTGYTIGKYPLDTCIMNPEFPMIMENCAGGLLCPAETNMGRSFDFSDTGWNGPYIEGETLIDPWGTPYIFDFDFICDGGPFKDTLCNGNSVISAISSLGPDKGTSYSDNEILPFCIP